MQGRQCIFQMGGGQDYTKRNMQCPRRGSEATERGEGAEGEISLPTIGTFQKFKYQNRNLEHLKTIF